MLFFKPRSCCFIGNYISVLLLSVITNLVITKQVTPYLQFFFKATLLQQVDDLLKGIAKQLNDANGLVNHMEDSLKPTLKELEELLEKIKNMEVMEEISQQVQLLRKRLAWSWVYDADRKLDAQHKLIEKLKGRIPSCQAKIDQTHVSCCCMALFIRLFVSKMV